MWLKWSYILSQNQLEIITLLNFSSLSLYSQKSSTHGKLRSIGLLRLFTKFIYLNFLPFPKKHFPPCWTFYKVNSCFESICLLQPFLRPFQVLFLWFPGSILISWETPFREAQSSSQGLFETSSFMFARFSTSLKFYFSFNYPIVYYTLF